MTTNPSEPSFDEFPQQVLAEIRQLRQNVEQLSTDVEQLSTDVEQLSTDVEQLSTDIESSNKKLAAETQKWDERFFQLSRDTLNFSRNVIITAAVVAVLAPLLREAIVTLVETFRQ